MTGTCDSEAGEPERQLPKKIPDDWSRVPRGSETFKLPESWRRLMMRYAGMWADSLQEIFNTTVGKENPTLAKLESGYIDEDYRDEYINFYAKTYRDLPRRCERLHFFRRTEQNPEEYLGYVVLRPIIGRPVCRTMLRPPSTLQDHISCRARYSTTPWGFPRHVDGFPFMSQDSQFGSCAHAVIWMIALYFHLRFRRPRYHLSDIVRSARIHHDGYPVLPSGGLTARQISAVLHDLDMTPVIYRLDAPLPDTPEAIACRYLNSRLPVMLLSETEEGDLHVQVLIGYGRDDDGGLFFVHHDDQAGPYLKLRPPARSSSAGSAGGIDHSPADARDDDPGPARWRYLVIPMPGRIFLSGEAAAQWAGLMFAEIIDDHPHLAQLAGGIDDGRLRLRSYVTEVADYKCSLRKRGVPKDVFIWHTGVSTSHWLWIVELQLCEAAAIGRRCVLGEIAIDATSDDYWVNPLFGNLPGLTMEWPSLGENMNVAESSQDETPYKTGCELHLPD